MGYDDEIKSVPSDIKHSGDELNEEFPGSRTDSVDGPVTKSSMRSGSSLHDSDPSSDKKSGSFSSSSVSGSNSGFSESVSGSGSQRADETTEKDEEDDRPFFANPFDPKMEKNEKILRLFLVFGILPLPIIGWFIGMFTSFGMKKKKKIHRKLSATLLLLSILSLVIGIIIVGYLLIKNAEVSKKDSTKTTDDKTPEIPKESSPTDPDPEIHPDIRLGDIIAPKVIVQDIIPQKQKPGEFKTVIAKEYTKPVYKYETPALPYIPPSVLEPPVTETKEVAELTFDYFEYKHPTSKNHMIILLRGLDSTWKWHHMFRFSEYIDSTVLVLNITKNDSKKSVSKILEDLGTEFEISKRKPLTLVADIPEDEMVAFESTFTSMKIKRVFAINPKMRCDTSKLEEEFVQSASLFDDTIRCGIKYPDFPLMLTIKGKIVYIGRKPGLGELKKLLYLNKEPCVEDIQTPERTKTYLDAIFSPLRKFLTTATEATKTNDLVREVLCTKIAENPAEEVRTL